MNAISSEPVMVRPGNTGASMKWAALQDAAAVVATMAGISPERQTPEIRNLPARLREVGDARRTLAVNGIEDLSAIMEPGLSALLAVVARGADARPAALALWREFVTSRNAIIALVPGGSGKGFGGGRLGPQRSA